MEATSLQNEGRGGSTSGSYPGHQGNDSPRPESVDPCPHTTNQPYSSRRPSRSSQCSTASHNPLKTTWQMLLGSRRRKAKQPEAFPPDLAWAAAAPPMQPAAPITFLTTPTPSRAEIIAAPIPRHPVPSPPHIPLPTIPQLTSPQEPQAPVSPVDFTTARSETRTSGTSSRSTTAESARTASRGSSLSPPISIGRPVHQTALSPSQMGYEELVAWIKGVMVTEVSWMADKARVEYYNYLNDDNQLYAGFVLDYEAKNCAATMWNRAHSDQQVPVPAKWITATETPPATLPPSTPPQAQTFPVPVPQPFAGATGGPSGSRPVPPTQPPLTAPTLWTLPRLPSPPKPPTPPAPWALAPGHTDPYGDLKPKILKDVESFKGVSSDISCFFNQCEMQFNLYNRHFRHHPHKVLFCVSRFEGEAQVWWDLQTRALGEDAHGFQRYPDYPEFKTQTKKRFWKDSDARIKGAQWEKLCQAHYADGDQFFQKFEELAFEAGVLENEQLMFKQIEKAARESSKNTIFAADGEVPTTYAQWKHRLLRMDYNFRVRKAENQANPSTCSNDRAQKTTTPQKGGQTMNMTPEKKDNTGTTYGGRGVPMDIDKLKKEGKCFRCGEKGHMSKFCPLQSWNKKKEEVRATTTEEPKTESKVEEVKDAAENGQTYAHSVEHDKYAHSNTSISTSKNPNESHNRYAALLANPQTSLSTTSNDEGKIRTESPADDSAVDANQRMGDAPTQRQATDQASSRRKLHRASSPRGETQPTKATGDKSPIIVTPIDTASLPHGMDGTCYGSGGKSADLCKREPSPIPHEVSLQTEQAAPTSHHGEYCSARNKRKHPDTRPLRLEPGLNRARDAPGTYTLASPFLRHLKPRVEVPDEEDDTSFKRWLAAVVRDSVQNTDVCGPSPTRKSPPSLEAERPTGNGPMCPEETQPTVVRSADRDAKVEKVPIVWTWMKPFTAEWTQHAIHEAKDHSQHVAILTDWLHPRRRQEVCDAMIKDIVGDEEFHSQKYDTIISWLHNLHQAPRKIRGRQGRSVNVAVQLETTDTRRTFSVKALLDSGCMHSVVNSKFVKEHNLNTIKAEFPMPVYNADNTRNEGGDITEYVDMRIRIGDHVERMELAVTNLGDATMFLGYDWLQRHNPIVNWETGDVSLVRCNCRKVPFRLPDEDPEARWGEEVQEGDRILMVDISEAVRVWAMGSKSNELAAEANKQKESKTYKEIVPEWIQDFDSVFSKEKFDKLPARKPWDHAIELIPNAKASLDCKVYPLN
ncbi:uncharacterized protein ARMOST_04345 [Armillaria ostoyae]|uniref:CCHC-type domain-containing protein n=1 Tax=Armillaria ostoyae TaxID=47428 RepID=A0A284QX25_ARMOS|nr:uncharacterized protein ARMOST_04345 [Armillaria ostoyae]